MFQTPTYVDIEVVNDNNKEEDEEGKSSSSSSSGSGGLKKKSLSDSKLKAFSAFGSVVEGKVPESAKLVP
jgi:hypothetical protein